VARKMARTEKDADLGVTQVGVLTGCGGTRQAFAFGPIRALGAAYPKDRPTDPAGPETYPASDRARRLRGMDGDPVGAPAKKLPAVGTVFLIGSGAVARAWCPVIRALKRMKLEGWSPQLIGDRSDSPRPCRASSSHPRRSNERLDLGRRHSDRAAHPHVAKLAAIAEAIDDGHAHLKQRGDLADRQQAPGEAPQLGRPDPLAG